MAVTPAESTPGTSPRPAHLLERAAVDGHWEHESLVTRVRNELPLLVVWTEREFRVRYRQSGLGILWSVVQPLATLAIYGVVMSKVLHVGSQGYPYIAFAYSGLVPWTFTSSGISAGIPSLMNTGGVVGKVYFPREVVPLSVVGASMIDLVIGTTIFVVILLIEGVTLSVHLVAIIPIFAVLILWVAPLAVLGALWTVFVRDLRYVVGIFLQLLFFATPIMYPPTLVKGSLSVLTKINPLAVLVTAIRSSALARQWPDWAALGVLGAIGAALFVVVIAYVRSVEPRVVDVM